MTLPLLRANSDLVAVAWLRGITELGNRVATTVPEDNADWGPSGFVQARTVGGVVDIYLPVKRPVVSVDAWAVKPDTQRPLWNVAAAACQAVIAATYDEANLRRLLTLPTGYPQARVLEAYPLTEARRIESDAAAYGHYQFDLALHWAEVPS